jgi:extracellular factor (EF) 3-hydroxypalmitic acid methyl ester biosynthesis protein
MENKLITSSSGAQDSFILARNSQGLEVRAGVLRLTRYLAVFEVYNPYSILQLSEVLSDFKIVMNDRIMYSGRAVISNVVNTGIMLVCEATLDEAWLDIDLFSSVTTPNRLREEFGQFIQEWQKIDRILPGFKASVADLQTMLMDLRRWLEQVELGIRSEPTGDVTSIERSVIGELEGPILPTVGSWFSRFDDVSEKVDEELRPVHRAFARRLLHPLVLCSPFVYRTYHKPLGYAGDYEMVNMILRDPYEGASLFAKIVNVCFLKNPPAEAHRNRISYLTQRLVEETKRAHRAGRRARIFNLGCGPAREIQNFMRQYDLSDRASFTLLDFNDETLEHASGMLQDVRTTHRRQTELKLMKKSVHQILKEAARPGPEMAPGTYDFVYCAGLFDYMSDRICKRLMNIYYDLLAPGGLLIATNVDASKPFRHSMEFILEWHLICRSQQQLAALNPDKAPPGSFSVTNEETGVNVFIEVRKPADGVNGQ